MLSSSPFKRSRKYQKNRLGCLTAAAAIGFFASLLYTLLGLPSPTGSCAGCFLWLVKLCIGLAACLGNWVTWHALKRLHEVINPWVFSYDDEINLLQGNPPPLVILEADHGYEKYVDVHLGRHGQLAHEAKIEDQILREVLENGNILLKLKGNHATISPFFVEVSHKAIF